MMQTFIPNVEPRSVIDSSIGRHGHHDVIHDVAFDYYGRRMATCSSDHNVRVWDYNERTEKWEVKEFRPHYGPVWRVCWAPPEYGHLLVTCSFDRSASIWEEVSTVTGPPAGTTDINAKGEGTLPIKPNTIPDNFPTTATAESHKTPAASDKQFRQSMSAQESIVPKRSSATSRQAYTNSMVKSDSQPSKPGDSQASRMPVTDGSLVRQTGAEIGKLSDASFNKPKNAANGPAKDSRMRMGNGSISGGADNHASTATWMRRSFLTDATGSVTDCEFAPRHVGNLQVAICSADGKLRVYESDTQNLQTWQLLCDLDCRIGALSAVSWCPARLVAPMIACGANEERSVGSLEHIAVFENVENENGSASKWKPVSLVNLDALRKRERERGKADGQAQSQGRLNPSRTEPNFARVDSTANARTMTMGTPNSAKRQDTKIAAGRFEVGSCRPDSNMTRAEGEQAAKGADELEPVCSVPVHDLAFAPNFGRAFQLLALATSSGVRIIKMTPMSGANLESNYALRPVNSDSNWLLNAGAFLSNGNYANESAQRRQLEIVQLESKLRSLFSDNGPSSLSELNGLGCSAHSRSTSAMSSMNTSSFDGLASDLSTQPNYSLRPDDSTRYGCECLFSDALNRRVWRVAWNVLGSRLAASLDDGRVMLYANDSATQRWTLTQVIEAASACHTSFPPAEENQIAPLSSSVPNTGMHTAVQTPTLTVNALATVHVQAQTSAAAAIASQYHSTHQATATHNNSSTLMRVDSYAQVVHTEPTSVHMYPRAQPTAIGSSRNGATSHPYYE